jgi:dolichol-phosphate mannosyltransferase
MKKAIVIVPTYNERENIQKVVPILESVFEKIKTWEMNILVVDDNSPDKTAEVVKQLQKKYKNLHLLLNQRKSGLGGAYLKGMAEAFNKLQADVIFEFDADLSHDPTKIPQFLKKIDEGYDLVLGSRYIPGGGIPANWGMHRKFLSVVGNKVIMFVLTDFRIHDWTGGYRAITKPVYEAVHQDLNSERFSGYTFQLGFLHKSMQKGFKVAEVPFHFVDREIGESKLGTESLKNTLM